MHLYSNFSIRRQMAPVQSIKFQIANFPIFCTRIIVIFWATCIGREVFSVVVMGNLTHILPVLHWLEVVIAFVSSWNYTLFLFNNSFSFSSTAKLSVDRSVVIDLLLQTLHSLCSGQCLLGNSASNHVIALLFSFLRCNIFINILSSSENIFQILCIFCFL